jgi:hypothetical protein
VYSEAVANDKEYARMVIASRKAQGLPLRPQPSESGASFRDYTAEVARLDTIIDKLNGVIAAVFKAAGSKSVDTPKPIPRPRTALDRVIYEERERAHKELVARVLPHKRKDEGAVS